MFLKYFNFWKIMSINMSFLLEIFHFCVAKAKLFQEAMFYILIFTYLKWKHGSKIAMDYFSG